MFGFRSKSTNVFFQNRNFRFPISPVVLTIHFFQAHLVLSTTNTSTTTKKKKIKKIVKSDELFSSDNLKYTRYLIFVFIDRNIFIYIELLSGARRVSVLH